MMMLLLDDDVVAGYHPVLQCVQENAVIDDKYIKHLTRFYYIKIKNCKNSIYISNLLIYYDTCSVWFILFLSSTDWNA